MFMIQACLDIVDSGIGFGMSVWRAEEKLQVIALTHATTLQDIQPLLGCLLTGLVFNKIF